MSQKCNFKEGFAQLLQIEILASFHYFSWQNLN